MIKDAQDGVRISHKLKHIITSLALLLVSLVIMLTIEILKHQLQLDNVFTKIVEHVATALFIAGIWHGLHEFFVKREFIRIHDRGVDQVLEAVRQLQESTTHADVKLGLTDTRHDVKAFDYRPLIAHDAPLTILLNDGDHWVSDHIEPLRRRFADSAKQTKFLLIHPESPFLDPLCAKINSERDAYRQKILRTVRELVKHKVHSNIVVLGHKAIVYQSIFSSGSTVVMTPYFMSSEKQNPPVFVFRDHGQDSFAAKLGRDIDVLEKSAVDISNYSPPLSSFYQYQGTPIGGDDAVCEHMIKLLKQTRDRLDVTHLANDRKSIDYIADKAFRAWLEINYAAARGEGGPKIRIRRLFLIDRQYREERVLLDTMEQMSANGIDVYRVWLDEVPPELHEDFSLYDDRHVMFRHQRRHAWISESGVSHSIEQKPISAFRQLFDKLLKQATRVQAL